MAQHSGTVDRPLAHPARRTRFGRARRARYYFVIPTAVYLFVGTLFLLLYALAVSFTPFDLQFNRQWTFVGLQNYREILGDEQFWRSIGQTAWIAVPALILEATVGFGLALFLNRSFRGRGLVISLLATPVMISATAAGMSFRLLYTPKYGPINDILSNLAGRDVLVDWLGSVDLARPAIVAVDVWHSAPFFMLLILAALQGIPAELYEATRVDGAGPWQAFMRITLPLIWPVLALGLLLRAIDVSRIFDEIYVMTQGGPGTQTQTISYYIYTEGITHFRIGYAAAMAWILCVVTILFAQVYLRVTKQAGGQ